MTCALIAAAAAQTIYFEQDGAFFAYRDRPFYQTAFDAMADDGMSLRVCPSFTCEAPFGVTDFDMAGAERAAAWFVGECERAGFDAQRAPSYDLQPIYPTHPECEAADLTATADLDCGEMSVAQFAAMRLPTPAAVAMMIPQQCQQQQAHAVRIPDFSQPAPVRRATAPRAPARRQLPVDRRYRNLPDEPIPGEIEPWEAVTPVRPDTSHSRSLRFLDVGAELLAAFAIIGGGMVLTGLATLL